MVLGFELENEGTESFYAFLKVGQTICTSFHIIDEIFYFDQAKNHKNLSYDIVQ